MQNDEDVIILVLVGKTSTTKRFDDDCDDRLQIYFLVLLIGLKINCVPFII